MKHLFKILLATCFLTCHSSSKTSKVILESKRLKEDFTVLRETLKEAHPGLYWYNSEREMTAFMDSLQNTLNYGTTDVEFFKLLVSVIAKIRCVHTNVRLSTESERLLSSVKCIPFDIYCFKEKVFIKQSALHNKYAGLELLTINEIPVKQLVSRFSKLIPCDGYNETFKFHVLATSFFREAYALYYGQPEIFSVEVLNKSGQKETLKIPPLSLAQINGTTPAITSSSHQQCNLNFIDSCDAAILGITSFAQSSQSFQADIDRAFQYIHEKKVKNLVIDLRNNGGGNNSNVGQLFSFIADSPFLHLKSAEVKTQEFYRLTHVENLKEFNNFRAELSRSGTLLVNNRYGGTKIQWPAKDFHFDGKLVVLANGGTVSAASEFVALVHNYHKGQIVGEETGGCYYGATGGNYLQLVLPNSKLRIRIPTIRILTAVKEDLETQPAGRGVLPDLTIVPTINDIILRRDIQLTTALKLFH